MGRFGHFFGSNRWIQTFSLPFLVSTVTGTLNSLGAGVQVM
jgi:hypothetical protein